MRRVQDHPRREAIRLFTVVCVAFAALANGGCREREAVAALPTIRMPLDSEPPSLDPQLAEDVTSFHMVTNLFEGLTKLAPDGSTMPAVAQSWERDEDGRVYRFHLDPQARWSDGKPVTADDFVYAWRRLVDPSLAATYAYILYDVENGKDVNDGKLPLEALGVRAVDPTTFEVRLTRPLVTLPAIAEMMNTFPVREDVVRAYGDRWTSPGHLVGNGAYTLESWRHDYRVVLRANPNYRLGAPPVPRIEAFVIRTKSTGLNLLETGQLDWMELTGQDLPAYRADPRLASKPQFYVVYYGFNTEKKPFDDVRVRQAFSLAIDRSELPRVLRGGQTPTTSWIPPGLLGYAPSLGLGFDPERARKLLAEAGFPGGKGFPRPTVSYNEDPDYRAVSENLAAQWRRNLGVEVTIDSQDWKVYLRTLATHPPEIWRLGWQADFADPDNFMSQFLSDSGNNWTRWANPRFDQLVTEASAEPDVTKRVALYDEAQRILTEQDVPVICLYSRAKNELVSPRVAGYEPNPMDLIDLARVSFALPASEAQRQ